MLLKPGEGNEIVIGPARVHVKTPESSCSLFIGEHTFPPGFPGPGPHHHPEMAHSFYVLEGLVRFEQDGNVSIAEPGTFVHIPAKVIHAFGSGGDVPARVLEINVPGGFDRYYAELAKAFTPGAPIDQDRLREVQRLHGIVPA